MIGENSAGDARPTKRLKVATIVGTRPEVIKLSQVIAALNEYTDHVLVHTGQNYAYELNEVFFEQLSIRKPDHFLNAMKSTAAETIGAIIAATDDVLRRIQPDAVLYYGDTNSCLGVIAAKRLKIPIFHMEAGNRCFDQRVPEELNRKIVDHLSDINMTLTEHARRYLLAEGIRPETVIKTGSSMKEVLNHYSDHIEASSVLTDLDLKTGSYFVVSSHREENVDVPENRKRILDSIRQLAQAYDRDVIFSTHPRTRKQLADSDLSGLERVRFVEPLGFLDYIKLQQNAFCVISDSGTITEESSLLGFPAVMIRETHERPEGMDVGTLIMSGLDPNHIADCVRTITDMSRVRERDGLKTSIVPDYDVESVSDKVVKIILSYTHYIRSTTWRT